MQTNKILILEDDELLGSQISEVLRQNDLESTWIKKLEDLAKAIESNEFSIGLFDINIGKDNALDFFVSGKEKGEITFPVLFLSANGDSENVIRALEAGANDFIHKPIQEKELILRLKTHMRLLKLEQSLMFEGIQLKITERSLHFGDKIINLSETQVNIVDYFFNHINEIVKRDDLISFLGKKQEIDIRTLDSHISQIRKKLRENSIRHVSIESVYRLGYRFTNNED